MGAWIPLWKLLSSLKPSKHRSGTSDNNESRPAPEEKAAEKESYGTALLSALLLGSAMVARGEIGLLIIEIGYNSTEYVSQEGFISGVWAILLNTIIGPVTVGLLVKYHGKRIGESEEWGVQEMNSEIPRGRSEV